MYPSFTAWKHPQNVQRALRPSLRAGTLQDNKLICLYTYLFCEHCACSIFTASFAKAIGERARDKAGSNTTRLHRHRHRHRRTNTEASIHIDTDMDTDKNNDTHA